MKAISARGSLFGKLSGNFLALLQKFGNVASNLPVTLVGNLFGNFLASSLSEALSVNPTIATPLSGQWQNKAQFKAQRPLRFI
jgi:hypothetical protein